MQWLQARSSLSKLDFCSCPLTICQVFNLSVDRVGRRPEDSNMYIDQDAYNIVFFSNDNFYADQAWALCTRLDYKNLHVLKGGVNQWFNTIINPAKPTENMPAEAFELYNFRKAASMYYGVVYPEQFKPKKVVVRKAPPKKKVITVKKKKKAPAEGGC